MRFDLELDKVSSINCTDLKYISSVLYDKDDDTILPAKYDNKTLFSSLLVNKGNINTEKFDNFKDVPGSLFNSYTINSLSFDSMFAYDSLLYPLFNGGKFYSANKEFIWSLLYVNREIKYNTNNNNMYSISIDSNCNTDEISIYTLSINYPGYIDKEREFIYKEYSISIDNTFSGYKNDYLYTIHEGVVYLNVDKLRYENIFIGKGNGQARMFALPEFPAYEVVVNGYNSSAYKVINGIIVFNADSVPINDEDISISYSVSPILSYNRLTDRDDKVYPNYSISPNNIDFKNGVVCVYNSYKIVDMPNTIELTAEQINEYNNVYKVNAKLLNGMGIPCKNKKINFEILSNGALFSATNTTNYVGTTTLNGEASALVFGDYSNFGMYIQKQWVSNNTIYIPKDINIDNISNIFLYIITNDDPILSYSSAIKSNKAYINETYTDFDISSYNISGGRRIAFINLINIDGKITQKFLKPNSITKLTNSPIVFKNLYIQDQSYTILSSIQDPTFISSETASSSIYTDGTIPSNRIDYYQYNFDTITQIDYDVNIPNYQNVIGYFLVFNRDIDIKAYYEDEYETIESNTVSINIKNIKAESPFTLSGIPISNRNTILDGLGYYTVSDYINNGYELYPCSYGCIYSDVIDKKCRNINKAYHVFYEIDSNNVFCIHTPEYDATIDADKRCPGVDARIINPFVIDIEE